jgi:hypothetical protein
MTNADAGLPVAYRIRLSGQIGPPWADWFDGMTITTEGGDTLITGLLLDQAALHGLLRRVRDLGLPLVSVTRLDGGSAEAPQPTVPLNQRQPDTRDREDR